VSGRDAAAKVLAVAGALALLATAAGHLKDYEKDTLRAAVLRPSMQAAFRAMHLLVGWQWIVLAMVALLAMSAETNLRAVLILFCGFAVLIEAALTFVNMGVFLGTELMILAAILTIGAGALFASSRKAC
jgi:hypothetical protein